MKYLLKNVVRLKQVVESPNPKLVPLEQYTKDQEKYLKWLADVEEKHSNQLNQASFEIKNLDKHVHKAIIDIDRLQKDITDLTTPKVQPMNLTHNYFAKLM